MHPLLRLTFLLISLLALRCASAEQEGTLVFNSTAADNENRWVAMPPRDADGLHMLAFVYVDPQAGFTIRLGGWFRVGKGGELVAEPDDTKDKAAVIVRLRGNPRVSPLTADQIRALSLEEVPDWLSYYKDDRPPEQHNVMWGSAYNHIGACEKALGFLEAAFKVIPGDERLLFELSYAYNCLRRPDDAKRVLAGGIESNPENFYLRREHAYSLLISEEWEEAIVQYRQCLGLAPESMPNEKAEVAMNLAQALFHTGNRQEADQWFAKAREWAPDGSSLSDYFKRQAR